VVEDTVDCKPSSAKSKQGKIQGKTDAEGYEHEPKAAATAYVCWSCDRDLESGMFSNREFTRTIREFTRKIRMRNTERKPDTSLAVTKWASAFYGRTS
jgi:hypothetical protein